MAKLWLPDYGIGWLAETPEEMGAALDAFLQQPVLDATTGLSVGYDFRKTKRMRLLWKSASGVNDGDL